MCLKRRAFYGYLLGYVMTTGYKFSSEPGFTTPWGSTYNNTSEVSWSGVDTVPSSNPVQKEYEEVTIPARYSLRNGSWVETSPELKYKRRKFTATKPKRFYRLSDNSFSKSVTDIKPDWFSATNDGGLSLLQGDMFNNAPLTSLWTPSDDYKLYSKLQSEVAGSDFHAGVFIAEGKKTVAMISDTAKRLSLALKVYKAGRRLNVVNAWKILTDGTKRHGAPLPPAAKKTSSNAWLQMQYGWLPLLKDAESGAQYLGYQTSAPQVTRVRVRRYVTGDRNGPRITSRQFMNFGPTQLIVQDSLREYKQLIAHINSFDAHGLVGLKDPLGVAWELIPFSFVADWFIPIGNYLSALNLNRALNATYVITHVRENVVTGGAASLTNGFTFVHKPRYRARSFVISRTVHASLPLRLPVSRNLTDTMSLKKCITSIALLVQRHGS